MEVAQRVEDKNRVMKAAREPLGPKGNKPITPNKSLGFKRHLLNQSITIGEKPSILHKEFRVKRMFDTEWQTRREKGVCFRYDEKYTLGHQCKNWELRVLLVQEDEEFGKKWRGGCCGLSAMRDGRSVELSLNSVVGLIAPSTMKVRGAVGSKEVVILVDCGATHNFLSLDLIR